MGTPARIRQLAPSKQATASSSMKKEGKVKGRVLSMSSSLHPYSRKIHQQQYETFLEKR
jgi:hypothetical protein